MAESRVTLRRLIVEFGRDGIQTRVLYRTTDGPRPGTKRRKAEASELAREGLRAALEALDGEVVSVGEAGFEVREDTLSAGPSKGESPLFLADRSNNCLKKGGQ